MVIWHNCNRSHLSLSLPCWRSAFCWISVSLTNVIVYFYLEVKSEYNIFIYNHSKREHIVINPKCNQHLLPPYSYAPESFLKITRINENIKKHWLLIEFSLSVLKEICREEYGECTWIMMLGFKIHSSKWKGCHLNQLEFPVARW